MSILHHKLCATLILIAIAFPLSGIAQQFIGLDTRNHSAIQMIPGNPAWVTNSKTGTEAMLFSANMLAGTNAFEVSKSYFFSPGEGPARAGIDYKKNEELYQKHLWANLEICGPAISFQYKDEHYIGLYTRARQIYRAGGIASTEMRMIGEGAPDEYVGGTVEFRDAGFTTHTFTEIGATYGRVLRDDYYNIIRGGITIKYLMGFVAGSVYTESLDYAPDSLNNIRSMKGDVTVQQTYNIASFIDRDIPNDLTSWFNRAGRGSLGMDIGVQYEYHPDGNPNRATPYLFSLAASITDLGSVRYVADTGSGRYDINVKNKGLEEYEKPSYEDAGAYLVRIAKDSLLGTAELVDKFNIGLPTALRLNADYNSGEQFNIAVNVLLNLRGNSKSEYKAAYVNYFNFTPTYNSKYFRIGLPFTVIGYQTIAAGLTFRAGPFFIGSTSALSMLASSRLKNIDAYAGLVWKFNKDLYKRH